MHASMIQVRWRAQVLNFQICYAPERAEEILDRWPDRVIELSRIFEHESPSSPAARAFIVRRALEVAGEPVPHVSINAAPFGVATPTQVRAYLAQLDERAKPLTLSEAAGLMAQVTGTDAAPVRAQTAIGAFGFRSRS
jgi:hypothetical protein